MSKSNLERMTRLETLGPYELLDRIAVGGMAEIYLARINGIHEFERIFVLKLIHPKYINDSEFMRMFVDEARLVAQLHHSNIAQVFDLGHSGDNYFIVMEYVHGHDLSEIISVSKESNIPVPPSVAIHIAAQVAQGLYYAHSKTNDRGRSLNIVHRDITPQNVLVSFFGEAKVVDFGVAKAALSARPETQAGIIKGKFKYMSPEQASGDRLDGRSDLFSAALLLYELLTGSNPYDGLGELDPRQTILRMREAKIPPVTHMRKEVPPQIDDILSRALARDRDLRYPTGLDFQIALVEMLADWDPGFTSNDTMEFLRRLYPQEMRAAHLPEPNHPRFNDGFRRAKDPSDARTMEVEDPSDDQVEHDTTVPVKTHENEIDATEETVTMAPLSLSDLSAQSIELQEEDLQLIRDIEPIDPEVDTETRQAIPRTLSGSYVAMDDISPKRRTTSDRRPTMLPSDGNSRPLVDVIDTTERPSSTDDAWLEPFPEGARETILMIAHRSSHILGLEPSSAFYTAIGLTVMLGTAMFFALIAIAISI